MSSRSLAFAEAARVLGEAGRAAGLSIPTFRSPPKVLGRDRTIRRRPDGSVTVAVRITDRPFVAVMVDMVDGVAATNRLSGDQAEAWRRQAWELLDQLSSNESMAA